MTPVSAMTARRIASALTASPPRVPVILGACGSGRTALLERLHAELGAGASQYVDIERSATTPERFLQAITERSPFKWNGATPGAGPRAAFEATLAFLTGARAQDGGPATFLLDEILELRTFESFPGLRLALRETIAALAASTNRFVLSTRYVARARRLLRDASTQFLLVQVTPLTAEETRDALRVAMPRASWPRMNGADLEELGRVVHALADGRPAYVRTIVEAMRAVEGPESQDPIGSLTALLAPDGRLSSRCGYCYELRLHRARGYGALKAILEILAREEPLTLTEISQRLGRTPGSTKDYLSWLEDVDLVSAAQKRYSFSDPMLRLWVRIHCRAVPATAEEIASEVQHYALARLPHVERAAGPQALASGQ
jgi:hypothetical protein